MRCYTDYRGMAQAEAARKDGIDVVSVVTPNVLHHAICKRFLEAVFPLAKVGLGSRRSVKHRVTKPDLRRLGLLTSLEAAHGKTGAFRVVLNHRLD